MFSCKLKKKKKEEHYHTSDVMEAGWIFLKRSGKLTHPAMSLKWVYRDPAWLLKDNHDSGDYTEAENEANVFFYEASPRRNAIAEQDVIERKGLYKVLHEIMHYKAIQKYRVKLW